VGDGKMLNFNLKYIDWAHPENNLFHVTEEFPVDSLDRQHDARPDLALFINGIPFAVIECKAPHIPVEQAVEGGRAVTERSPVERAAQASKPGGAI
jgi:type I restriction enzyme R subunit